MGNESKIRNFSIIAHVDHGKSTLADRMMELCKAITERESMDQLLDSMDIERERGITIKAQTVRLNYQAKNGETYILNLMDTPGHVDFAYEVSRCLAACEGSILLVDSTQGVEAQTFANAYKALENNHEIIVVLNKTDLASAEPEKTAAQVEDSLGIPAGNAIKISAKIGLGVEDVLEAITKDLPSPQGSIDKPLKALLVDAWYDIYLGVITLVRVIDGCIKQGDKIVTISNGKTYDVETVGVFSPKKTPKNELNVGEIGYITTGMRDTDGCQIGDTITHADKRCESALAGFKLSQQVVFCSLFPAEAQDFHLLMEALGKLKLNDNGFSYEKENSTALGYGFRCGFLGLLHLEVIEERLEREFGLNVTMTAPSVKYKIFLKDGTAYEICNAAEMPDPSKIEKIEEPWILTEIIIPAEYVGHIVTLCEEKRGSQINIEYNGNMAVLKYEMALAETIFDFHDSLKSITKGYGSFEWTSGEYKESEIIKMTILINGESVDALSYLIHKESAYKKGKSICERLKTLIPRQNYKIAIQAAINGKIVARETLDAYRKDVTAKLYGGDVTRKMKLLEKQKRGKKRMREIGKISVPQDVFVKVLKID